MENFIGHTGNFAGKSLRITSAIAIGTFMAFDPILPANNSPIVSAELRNQLNALKALIDAQAAQITALQDGLNNKATRTAFGEFDPGFSDPPATADLENIRAFINDLVVALQS